MVVKHYCPGSLEHLAFLGGDSQDMSTNSKLLGESKLLRRSILTTEGSFGSNFQRAVNGGWKTRGGRETYCKTPPQKRFGPPHLRYVSPPFFSDSLSFSLKGKRHRPDQPQFLRPPKLVLENTVCSTFPPPPKFTCVMCSVVSLRIVN